MGGGQWRRLETSHLSRGRVTPARDPIGIASGCEKPPPDGAAKGKPSHLRHAAGLQGLYTSGIKGLRGIMGRFAWIRIVSRNQSIK
jgi:hypothetical protein